MTAIELWEKGAYKQRQEEYLEEEESDNEFGDPEGYVDDITDEGNSHQFEPHPSDTPRIMSISDSIARIIGCGYTSQNITSRDPAMRSYMIIYLMTRVA